MMTVSALCRLRPMPPARVDSMKRKCGLSGALKEATRSARAEVPVLPSRRR